VLREHFAPEPSTHACRAAFWPLLKSYPETNGLEPNPGPGNAIWNAERVASKDRRHVIQKRRERGRLVEKQFAPIDARSRIYRKSTLNIVPGSVPIGCLQVQAMAHRAAGE
jgi:hypothetical protein